MTGLQLLHYQLQHAATESDVFAVWARHREQLKDASFILSVPGPSPFGVTLPKKIGDKARLISTFVHDDLFFLNDHIYTEMEAGRESTFKIAYTISFDTNAASYLRRMFAGHEADVIHDMRKLLLHFHPHKLNWQVVPYLMENIESIAQAKNSQVLFETILAAEKLSIVDVEHLRLTGEIRLKVGSSDPIPLVAKRLSDTARHYANGLDTTIIERWETFYVTVLFMSLQQIQRPNVQHAPTKLKSVIKFMDKEFHALMLDLLVMAWDLFNGGKQTSIFKSLQETLHACLKRHAILVGTFFICCKCARKRHSCQRRARSWSLFSSLLIRI